MALTNNQENLKRWTQQNVLTAYEHIYVSIYKDRLGIQFGEEFKELYDDISLYSWNNA